MKTTVRFRFSVIMFLEYFLILGLGPFVANFVWPKLGDVFRTAAGIDFHRLFLVPCGVALASAICLFLFFRPPERGTVDNGELHP